MSVHDIVTECAKYSLLECQEMAQREDLTCSLVHSSAVSHLLVCLDFNELNYHFPSKILVFGGAPTSQPVVMAGRHVERER